LKVCSISANKNVHMLSFLSLKLFIVGKQIDTVCTFDLWPHI